MKSTLLLASVLAIAGLPGSEASAQTAAPAMPAEAALPPIPEAVDTAWPGGTIRLDIDATDNRRGVFRVTETIPLAPGTRQLTLLFPQWLPGKHGPRGALAELVDVQFLVDGKPVPWKRDPVEVYAFRLSLPEGAREVVAQMIHASPLAKDEGRVVMTPDMLNLQWEAMSLYPAGHYVSRIRVKPSVVLPRDWTPAVALDGETHIGNRYSWNETDYETLVDSPIFAGAYFRRWDLGNSVRLNAVADAPDLLTLRPADLARLTAMVDESLLVFGAPPFDRYEFLVSLSSRMGDIGLEHLRSSENLLEPRNFLSWDSFDWDRNVLPHELVHSWNGKYRRPDKLWTPDYRKPMQGNLLWVYEGQTQFWGQVLAARSGVQGKDVVLGAIARAAAGLAEMPGRGWRSVEDTTFDPVFAARKPKPYASLSRGEDYYWEGALVWLEADQIIRAGTGGRKGLDDFAKAFFSAVPGGPRISRYTLDDIVATLNQIYPQDWAGFFTKRIDRPDQPAPLAGIEKAGYRLVWRGEPNPFDKSRMEDLRRLDLWHSLGVEIDQDGTIADVRWDSPAFRAGLVTGARIVAAESIAYDHDVMRRALTAVASVKRPLELLVRRGERFMIMPIDYHDGLRWPWLQRSTPDQDAPLDRLLAPRRR
jgi:predicted metalloprotease with PDZ domain